MDQLNDLERAIVVLIAQGETAKTIARRLEISPRSVERRTDECRRKLGVTNKAHLVATVLGGRLSDELRSPSQLVLI